MNPKAKVAYSIPVIAAIVLPYLVFVASAAPRPINSNVWNPTILKGPLVTCWGPPITFDSSGREIANTNACLNLCDLVGTSANVIYFGIGVIIWIVAPILIAWGGLKFMLSRGDPGGTSEARKMMLGVVIGILIVLCAYIIVLTFVRVVNITGVGGFGGPSCVIH